MSTLQASVERLFSAVAYIFSPLTARMDQGDILGAIIWLSMNKFCERDFEFVLILCTIKAGE
jgi:hypothetical protein